jgi:AcrR family transcriptional regulator
MKENIKEKITESFEKYYNQFGYKKTSVDEISKDLHISKKTIYKYFESKDQIFDYLINRTADHFRELIEPKLCEFSNYEKKVEQLVLIIFQEMRNWLIESKDSFDFRFKFDLTKKAFQQAYHDMARDLYVAGIENNEFSKRNIDLTIKFLDSILVEGMQLIHTNNDFGIEHDTASMILKLLK